MKSASSPRRPGGSPGRPVQPAASWTSSTWSPQLQPPQPLDSAAAPALDQFYARLLRALEQEHQRQAWEQQQKHDREMLSLSQRSSADGGSSAGLAPVPAHTAAYDMGGGGGGGAAAAAAATDPPRSPRRIMAGMTMAEIDTQPATAGSAHQPVAMQPPANANEALQDEQVGFGLDAAGGREKEATDHSPPGGFGQHHHHHHHQVGPEVGGRSPRRRPRTTAAELANAANDSSAAPYNGRGSGGSGAGGGLFTGRGFGAAAAAGGGSAVGGGSTGAPDSGLAGQLARKEAEVAKLTNDIKRLIEQQMPMQQVVRDLVEQCKQLQEKNSFLQSEDAEEDTHAQMQQLLDDSAEHRRVAADLKRQLAAAEEALRVSREDEESAKGLQDNLVAKNAELLEKTLVLEAKIADLKGERGQLKDEVKRVNKALDRMRWPAGTLVPNELSGVVVDSFRSSSAAASIDAAGAGAEKGGAMIPSSLPATAGFALAMPSLSGPKVSISGGSGTDAVPPQLTSASVTSSLSSSVPNSMFHYPRAPNANTESDFNIFTGEPQDHGVGHRVTRHPNVHKQRNYPTTRMSWALSESRRSQEMNAPAAGLPSGATALPTALDRMRMRSSQLGAQASGQPYDLILPDRYNNTGTITNTDTNTSGGSGGGGAVAGSAISAAESSVHLSLSQPNGDGRKPSLPSSPERARSRTSVQDPVVRSLLEGSIKDKARERRQLETDMTKGHYDAEAQIKAAKRILELDRQALELQNRLMA
eukprot:gene5014-29838_t